MSIQKVRGVGPDARRRFQGWCAGLLALAVAGVASCDGEGGGITWPDLPQTRCTSADTWIARGFQYEHFADASPEALLTASVRVGEVVPLEVTTLLTTGCEDAVASVAWQSTAPAVAALTPTTRLEADLEGRRAGETVVTAEVTLADGSQVSAELYAVPEHGSPLLRVYTVRVVR